MSATPGTAATLLVVLVACILSPVSSLFADQSGEVDWYQQHLGLVQHASFHPTKPRACLTTQQHTVGCVNLRDGSIAWRKRFGDGDSFDALLQLEKPAHLVTASYAGSVKAFDAAEGFLVWERQLATKAAVVLSSVTAEDSPDTHVIIVAPGTLQVRSSCLGSMLTLTPFTRTRDRHTRSCPATRRTPVPFCRSWMQ